MHFHLPDGTGDHDLPRSLQGPDALLRYLWVELTSNSRLDLWKDQYGGEPKHHSREARSTSALFYSKFLNQKNPNPHWLKKRRKWDYFSIQIFHILQHLRGQLCYPEELRQTVQEGGGISDTVWDPEIIKHFWMENCNILGVLGEEILTNSSTTKLLIKKSQEHHQSNKAWKVFCKKSLHIISFFFPFLKNELKNLCRCLRSVHFQLPLNCFLMRALKFKVDIHGGQCIEWWNRGHLLHEKSCGVKQEWSWATAAQTPPQQHKPCQLSGHRLCTSLGSAAAWGEHHNL